MVALLTFSIFLHATGVFSVAYKHYPNKGVSMRIITINNHKKERMSMTKKIALAIAFMSLYTVVILHIVDKI